MGEIKKDEVLAKVAPDRRRFVETMLALTGYVTPTVRSFLMASAMTPIFAGPGVTTTPIPTTTRRHGQGDQGGNGQGNQGGNGQGNQGQNQQIRQGNRPGLIDRQLQRTGPKKR
jgi:hypothetical protein